MSTNDFIRLREKDWSRLEQLLGNRTGRKRLSATEVQELGILYRAVVSDLAYAQRDYAGQQVVVYLNQLLSRAHNYIYQEDTSDLKRVRHYLLQVIPQTFRQSIPFTVIAYMLFVLPGIVAFRMAYTNPDIAPVLGLESQRETLANQTTWTDIPVEDRPYASTFIMSNNIRIAILAFGGGMAFGLFAVYLLAMNGVSFGAILGLAFHYGMGMELLDFVFAHGLLELNVIFIAGGAGLQIGHALINPQRHTRRDAVNLAALRAVPLVVAAIPLLVIAGIIEGFLSPSDLPFLIKVVVGFGVLGLTYSYLLLAGREHNTK